MPYNINKIKFQTYSWVYGTTSFRVSELKYKIEKQLLLIENLRAIYLETNWKELQNVYFKLLVEAGLSKNSAKEVEKDARQKSSSLKDLGLITDDRKITYIGKLILETTLNHSNIKFNNIFSIRDDSYLYFKQFLKIEFSKNSDSSYNFFHINPFLALIYSIIKLDSISNDFFNILLPIQKNFQELRELVNNFIENKGILNVTQILLDKISSMDNYQNALSYFLENEKNDNTFKTIFLNMKGGDYDLPYKRFYELVKLYSFSDNLAKKQKALKEVVEYISNYLPSSLLKSKYYKLMFGLDKKPRTTDFTESLISYFESSLLYKNCNFDENFFYLVNLVKWYTNLEKEYADNNKRFLNLTDTFVFDYNCITLNPIIKVFFADIIDELIDSYILKEKNEYQKYLYNDLDLAEINPLLNKDINLFSKQLQKEFPALNVENNLQEQIFTLAKFEKLKRFNILIDNHFDNATLIKLLCYLKNREDKKILEYKNINWDTNVSTIFEYLVGISWYLITNKQGDITEFLNMSLDANLLPLRFAGSGKADIVYKYLNEDILIEVTLSNDENQRRMELEPVSRHLGRYKLLRKDAYAIFIASYLDPNVLVGFRSYKYLKYYDKNDTSKFVSDLKIIPLSIDDIIFILQNNINYNSLRIYFENIYRDDEKDGFIWYHQQLKPKLRELCN